MACLSSRLYLMYPRTSEMVLDLIGGARTGWMFHPVSFLMSLSICPPFPVMAPGLSASTVTTPVSKSK